MVLALAIWFVFWLRSGRSGSNNRMDSVKSQDSDRSLNMTSQIRVSQATQTNAAAPLTKEEALAKLAQEKLEGVRQHMEHDQIPLDFYGRVVDENGNGVEGATVKFSYTRFDLMQPQYLFLGNGQLSVTSDGQGNFAIRGVKGYGFIVDVRKNGYYGSTNNFQGSNIVLGGGPRVSTGQNSPMVFHLHKKSVPEPLLSWNESYILPRNGTPVFVDLLTSHTNSATPDLKIQAWTDDAHKDAEFRYAWRVRVEFINGGAVEQSEEFQYAAPEQGYQSYYERDYPQSRTNDWRNSTASSMFLRLRDGTLYAKLDFEMISGGDHFCMLRLLLNPSGSRNLEPDPQLLFGDLDSYNAFIAKRTGAAK